ncbi:MAG TPA: DUF2933 domain-containing protein [Chromatiales bacterium]|nr:DUF2933 domain-containing protein [Chromatiales bacterium]HEX22677.1 DUF2933 domain-containing protein [Chromatiales bacterium]
MAWLADYWLLIVLLLACVGMHFLHGGHGKSGDSNDKHRH